MKKFHNLDKELRDKCTKTFKQLDKNNNGYISLGEFLDNFFEKSKKMDYDELRKKLDKLLILYNKVDKNNDKLISLDEVIQLQYELIKNNAGL